MTVRQTTDAPSGLSAHGQTAFGVIVHALASAWHAAEDLYLRIHHRSGIRQMLELDDHLLCDMGITRGDVLRAANLPLDRSAGEELRRVSRSRTLR